MTLTKNVGSRDRWIRLVIAAVLIFFGAVVHQFSPLGIGLVAVGLIFLLTSIFRLCPLYTVLRINTCKPSATTER